MGFEPTNGGFADQPWISILLVRLAFTPALLRDFGPYLGPIVPKLFVVSWGEPLRWHKLFGHSFRFPKSVLASPSRRRGLGKGTAFESPSPAVL